MRKIWNVAGVAVAAVAIGLIGANRSSADVASVTDGVAHTTVMQPEHTKSFEAKLIAADSEANKLHPVMKPHGKVSLVSARISKGICGKPVTVTAEIKNVGKAPATGHIAVEHAKISPYVVEEVKVPFKDLKPGETSIVQVPTSWTPNCYYTDHHYYSYFAVWVMGVHAPKGERAMVLHPWDVLFSATRVK